MLGRSVADALREVEPPAVWAPAVRAVLSGCDAVLANLECCISERGEPTTLIPGKPFFFRAPPKAVESLRAARVAAVTLANNHALDFGPDALLDTLDHLAAGRIEAAGAGRSPAEARRGAVLRAGGTSVGLLSVSDHPREYAVNGPGIGYADLRRGPPDWLLEELERLRANAELVVVSPHWGPNMTTEPAAWQLRCAAALVEAGADLVAGHSAHVFHGIGRERGRPLLYDLGDALDDYAVDRRLRNDLGVLALWRPRGEPALELVGLRLHFCRTDLARGADADWIAERLTRACAALGTRVERVSTERLVVG
jgi:poly-gamma-glutamate capsule biosynthesis protein CapA/YwtB (metallophosphatase superfamily)